MTEQPDHAEQSEPSGRPGADPGPAGADPSLAPTPDDAVSAEEQEVEVRPSNEPANESVRWVPDPNDDGT